MARGSLGRERMLSGVVGISAHQPPASAHQEDLNNELLAVSLLYGNYEKRRVNLLLIHVAYIYSNRTPAN